MDFSPNLNDFRGKWTLEREIESEIEGQAGCFSGHAEFCEADGGLAYREVGELRLAGVVLSAQRTYFWRAVAGRIEVLFADGRAFHRFSPSQTGDTHYCDPDVYRVAYGFSDWPRWSSRWRVTGPRKDYVMQSRYAPFARSASS